ncbi:MAG: glycosyltransferase family 4 protein [Chloroflexi bacterium]|nr:glycosyltransferase family 4 protein [Chloroflexota bacterium]
MIAPEISHAGGQQRATLYLVRHLLERGHTVQAVTRAVDGSLRAFPELTVHRVPVPERPMLAGYFGFLILASVVARRLPPSDVVLNTENTALAPADLAYSHYCHSAYRRRRVLSLQSPARNLYCFAFDALNTVTEQVIYRRLSRAVVAVSHQHRAELVREAHVPPDRVHVVHNGVDTSEFRPLTSDADKAVLRATLGLPAEAPLLLFAGDLRSPRKGLDTVLRAMPSLPGDLRLIVAGEARRSPYPAAAQRAGLAGRVDFIGFRSDLADVMRACDVFVLPTHYDPFGLVILEAMASGLPSIATAQAGASEVITSGVDGLVIADPDDAQAVANGVRELLDDPARRRAMGAAARETAERHDWSRVAAQMEALLLGLSRESRARTSQSV